MRIKMTNAISGVTITVIIDPLQQASEWNKGYIFQTFDLDLFHKSQK